jgi:ATP synthase protein I
LTETMHLINVVHISDNRKKAMPHTPLDDLDQKIRRAKEKYKEKPAKNSQGISDASLTMRVASDLIAAVCVGTISGIYLDKWLGTSPFLLILCFFLGIAGGAANIYRLVKKNQPKDE